MAEALVLCELGGALSEMSSRSASQRALEVLTEARDIMKEELPPTDARIEHVEDDIASLHSTLGEKGARW